MASSIPPQTPNTQQPTNETPESHSNLLADLSAVFDAHVKAAADAHRNNS